jgi:hypothetical protein
LRARSTLHRRESALRQTRHPHPPLGDLRHFRRWREALEGKTSFRACRSFIAPMSKRQLRAVHSVMTSRRGRSGDFTYRPHADADGGAHPCRHARAWKNAGGHVRSDACRPRSRRAQRRRACPARSRARVADVGRFRRVSRGLGDFAIAKRSTMRKVRVAARRDGVRGGLSPAAIHETGRRIYLPRGATPREGADHRTDCVARGQSPADYVFNLAALRQAYPIKRQTSVQRTQAPEEPLALDPLENTIRRVRTTASRKERSFAHGLTPSCIDEGDLRLVL